MKKNIFLIPLLFLATASFSQKKATKKIDSSIVNSNKINFFDSSVFKPKSDVNRFFNPPKKTNKTTYKMPVFIANGNFSLKVFKIDTLKNYSLKIYK